jgi:hypothetical protein
VELLTKPMTTVQRQARHAKNFTELPPLQRAVYLHTVAFAISQTIGGVYEDGTLCLTSDALVRHLLAVPSIYDAPSIPSEYSQLVAAHLAIVKVALQELNALIAEPIANNSNLQQAMYAGAVCGLFAPPHDFF